MGQENEAGIEAVEVVVLQSVVATVDNDKEADEVEKFLFRAAEEDVT